MTKTDVKQKITAKNIIRACALIAILFFFVPTVTVSCAGEKESLSASRIMLGREIPGTAYSSAHPILIILLLLPAAVLAVWQVRALHDRARTEICAGCSFVDAAGWTILVLKCRELEDTGFSVRLTWACYLNFLALALVFALSLLVLLGKISLTEPVLSDWPGAARRPLLMTGKKKAWKCPSCGRENEDEHGFCSGCGTERPGGAICPECGGQLADGTLFCGRCGKKAGET